MGTLGIGQVLRAIQFDQLHRGSIAERSLLGNTQKMRSHHTGFRRIDGSRIDGIATKISPGERIPTGTFRPRSFVFGIIPHRQHAVATADLGNLDHHFRFNPVPAQTEIQHVLALDQEGFTFNLGRTFGQGIDILHDSRVRNDRIFDSDNRSYRRTRKTCRKTALYDVGTRQRASQGIESNNSTGILVRMGIRRGFPAFF